MRSRSRGPRWWVVGLALVVVGLGGRPLGLFGQQPGADQDPPDDQQSFRFTTGVELINVTATVTDRRGRFVPNLQKEDFLIYEDGELQAVTYFSNERVPVSLGIVLDTSGSMEGEKMFAAREALDRFSTTSSTPRTRSSSIASAINRHWSTVGPAIGIG